MSRLSINPPPRPPVDHIPQLVYFYRIDRHSEKLAYNDDNPIIGPQFLECRLVMTTPESGGGGNFIFETRSRDALGKESWTGDGMWTSHTSILHHLVDRLLKGQPLDDKPTFRCLVELETARQFWTSAPAPTEEVP